MVDNNVSPQASPQIFASNGIYGDSTLTYPVSTGHQLIYTRYDVTTVASPLMGVKAGLTGTLHAFTMQWKDARTAPWVTTTSGGKQG